MAACCLRCCAIEDFMQGLMRPRIGRCCSVGTRICSFRWSEGVQGASGKPPACMARDNSVRKRHAGGHDAPTPARMVGLPSREGSTFFRVERKYQRKQAARRLQRRPTSLCTAAKPCAALGLGYALHGFQPFLALVGLRPPLAVGFGLREPNGWTTRIYSGRPIPA